MSAFDREPRLHGAVAKWLPGGDATAWTSGRSDQGLGSAAASHRPQVVPGLRCLRSDTLVLLWLGARASRFSFRVGACAPPIAPPRPEPPVRRARALSGKALVKIRSPPGPCPCAFAQ